jgi:hypothetical protein
MRRALAIAVACTGCSSLLGIDDLSGPPDAGVPRDMAIDVIVPGSIQISGMAVQVTGIGGNQPLPMAAIEARALNDQTMAFANADPNGNFTLFVDTGGQPFDGYLHSSGPNNQVQPTHTYFLGPLTGDTNNVVLQHLDNSTLDQLAQICGVVHTPGSPFYAIQAADVDGAPRPMVTVTTFPDGKYCSDQSGGFPQPGNVTGSSGIVFAFEVPEGAAVVFADPGSRNVTAPAGTTMFVPVTPSSDN